MVGFVKVMKEALSREQDEVASQLVTFSRNLLFGLVHCQCLDVAKSCECYFQGLLANSRVVAANKYCTLLCMYVCMHVCACMCACMFVHVCVHVCVHVWGI